jgi:hypothetical protein
MKTIKNIMQAVNNNAIVGLNSLVKDAKASYEYKRGGSLLYVINPIISSEPISDERGECDDSLYREGYCYACGYAD